MFVSAGFGLTCQPLFIDLCYYGISKILFYSLQIEMLLRNDNIISQKNITIPLIYMRMKLDCEIVLGGEDL